MQNKKTRSKCPYCGSTDTARILYGKPFFSDELQKQLDSGEVRLGGCCITGIKTGDGRMIRTDPEYFCNHCEKEFGFPEYLHE